MVRGHKINTVKNFFLRSRHLIQGGLFRVLIFANPFTYSGIARIVRLAAITALIGVTVFGAIVPAANSYIEKRRYQLSDESSQLLGKNNANLAAKFSYDNSKQTYTFNKEGLEAVPKTSKDPVNPTAVLKQMQAQVGGGGKKDKSLYSVELPTDSTKGITYYDNNLALSFSVVPQFKQAAAKNVDGRVVYPLQDGLKAIYTAKTNGLKEDIILEDPSADSASFSYELKLPKELEARLTEQGGLGIYSADPSLFGTISYGTPDDEARVMSARTDGKKDHLVFALPAPIISQSKAGKSGAAMVKFALNGQKLTVEASGLLSIDTKNYPISIDPSVVITSSADFSSGNNEDNSIDYTTTGQANRNGLTGGNLGTFGGTVAFTTARARHTSVAYNGYIYVLGGDGSAATLNTVEYAPINVNGAVGTWLSTTSFTTARNSFTSVAYNGYMYVMGGYSSAMNDVQLAKINADGTLGTWTTTTAFTTARFYHTSVAYNGYMYVLGGTNGVGAFYSDVQYAPINADGTVGTWTTTTAFTTGRYGHTSVVHNGYMYVIGGTNAGTLSDVQYAQINANGTLGTWAATTSISSARAYHSSAVYGGYIYVLGGGSNLSDAQYAQINTNGSLGTWVSTNSFTTGRRNQTTVAYNGYLYVLGGYDGTTTYYNTVQFSKIDPPGVTSVYNLESNPATARAGAAGLAYGGYIYSLGGCTAITTDICTTPSTLVSYAAINADGSLGTWANTTTALPAARGFGTAVAYEGFLYYLAGRPTSTTVSPTIYYAAIGAAGNITTAWTTIAAPTGLSARYGQTTELYNGRVYVMGGCTTASGACAAYLNDVQYAALNSAGGITTNPSCANNFCPLNSFTTARFGHSSVISGSNLYISGGTHATSDMACNGTATNDCSDVQYAAISSTGTLGTWTATTNFSTARYSHAMYESNGYLYVSSGKTIAGTFLSTVYFAKVTTSGALMTDTGCGATWCSAQSTSSARSGSAYAANQGKLYLVSGQTAASTLDTSAIKTIINNGGSGSTNAWATATSIPAASGTYNLATVAYNGFLYTIGGDDNDITVYDNVQYAPLNANGTVGAWTATTVLPATRKRHSAVAVNGYLYVLGDNSATSVIYATINPTTGAIGTWLTTNTFTNPRDYAAAFTYNGYMYIAGGSSGATTYNDVQYAPINANGSLGTWLATTSFTTTRYSHSATVYNGIVYILGGGFPISDNVQYATIAGNGTVGAWTNTTSLSNARFGFKTYAANGYMYAVGGDTNNTTIAAPILSGGSLGKWNYVASYTSARSNAALADNNGYLYQVGGVLGGTIEYASLNAIPKVSKYSKIIDLGTNTTISNISYSGTLPGGKVNINYRLAPSTGVFGATQSAAGFTNTCTAGGTTRFVYINVSLDETKDAAFLAATTANIQDLTVNFSSSAGGGVLPVERLKFGKTLQQATGLSGLDTLKTPAGGAICT